MAERNDKRGRPTGNRGSSGRSSSGPRQPRQGGGKPRQSREGSSQQGTPGRREQLRRGGTSGGDLPKWIRDEVFRSTPKDRRDATLVLLTEAADAFADGRFPKADGRLMKAKQLSSRTPTIRELLGLTSYRMGKWDEALRELRAYRRIAGDTTHMPVEMDCLRALERWSDVEKVWDLYQELGGLSSSDCEMKVVYASHLLDRGDPRKAWKVANPGRLKNDAREWDLRQWYVAARAAAALGDKETARQLATAVEQHDIGFPGLTELLVEIDAAG